MKVWHVYDCRTGKEKAAARELRLRGLSTFVPVLPLKVRNKSRYWHPPAIPGYVLIEADAMSMSKVYVIRSAEFADGEKCVHERVPGEVSGEELREFLAFLETLEEQSSVKHSVKEGDKVTLQDGRIAGTVASVKGGKVNVLIALFNSTRLVEVKPDAIQLQNEATSPSISLHKTANHGTRLGRDGGRRAAGGQSRL